MSYYSTALIDGKRTALDPNETYISDLNMWKTGCTGGMSIQAALFDYNELEQLPPDAIVEMSLSFSNDPDVFPYTPIPTCVYTITKDPIHITVGTDLKIARFIRVTFTNLSTARVRCHATPCLI